MHHRFNISSNNYNYNNNFNNRSLSPVESTMAASQHMCVRPFSLQGNDLKKGMLIKIDGDIFVVLGKDHARSGKGGGFVQATIRNIRGGSKITKRFRSKGDKIEEVVVDDKADYQV